MLIGCNSSRFTIKKHGAPIAQQIGKQVFDLEYISNGDFASLDELTNGFSADTKVMIALTETSLFWRNGLGENGSHNPFHEIPLENLTGISWDGEALRLEINEQVHALRLTEWNPFQASFEQTSKFLKILRDQNVAELADHPLTIYRFHRSTGNLQEIHDHPEDIAAQDHADQAYYDHVSSYGDNGGVPLTPH